MQADWMQALRNRRATPANEVEAGDPLASLLQPPLDPAHVMRETDLRRRRRLLGIISLGVLVATALLIPSALIPALDRVALGALLIALVGTLVAYVLNATGKVNAGGYALIVGIFLAISWEILAKARSQPGIDLSDTRLYDLFVLPIVVSTVTIGRRGPVIFGGAAIAFTIASFLLMRHTPELQQYWDGAYKDAIPGSVYDLIALPCAIQMLTAVAAWLGADSVRRALLEASRSDELAVANDQVQAQARAAETSRYRLQQGLAHLQHVHAAVARGQWETRATIAEGELMPVALSLNLLLDRLSRLIRETEDRERVNAAAHDLAIALRRLRAGEPYNPPNYTGTPFDEVLVELARLRNVPPSMGGTGGPRSLTAQDLMALIGSPGPAGPAQGDVPFLPRNIPPGAQSAEAWPSLEASRRPASGEPLPEWLRQAGPSGPEDASPGGQHETSTAQQPGVPSYLPPWLASIQSGGDVPQGPAAPQPTPAQNLPPWLREVAEGVNSQPELGTHADQQPPESASETAAENPSEEPNLPPWLQDIQ